jgi:hypothetical protein
VQDFIRWNAIWRSCECVRLQRVVFVNPVRDWLAKIIDFDASYDSIAVIG